MKMLAPLALLGALLLPDVGQTSESLTVMCHDPARGIVQRMARGACSGIPVSDAEAVEIEEFYTARRAAKMEQRRQSTRDAANNPLQFRRAGTGFAINREGAILTNRHVVEGCHALRVSPQNGAEIPAEIRAADEGLDLAVLRAAHRPRMVARFASVDLDSGQPLALVGYPKRGLIRIAPKLTPVWAASTSGEDGQLALVGDVRSGNSGGPVFDSRGRVVGVVRARVDTVAAAEALGRPVTQIGAAISARAVMGFLERARTPHKIDGTAGIERSGRELFDAGAAMTYRINCMMRR